MPIRETFQLGSDTFSVQSATHSERAAKIVHRLTWGIPNPPNRQVTQVDLDQFPGLTDACPLRHLGIWNFGKNRVVTIAVVVDALPHFVMGQKFTEPQTDFGRSIVVINGDVPPDDWPRIAFHEAVSHGLFSNETLARAYDCLAGPQKLRSLTSLFGLIDN